MILIIARGILFLGIEKIILSVNTQQGRLVGKDLL